MDPNDDDNHGPTAVEEGRIRLVPPNDNHHTNDNKDDDSCWLPHVTVQICTYNEGDVIRETIAAASQLDWPLSKLTIHVLDDSTNQASMEIVEHAVQEWRQLRPGLDLCRRTRPTLHGYKAGNLRHHCSAIQGDLVAYFDADHRPEATFLRVTIPYFYHGDGTFNPNIGLVQTPWAYDNTHYSLLTESGTSNCRGRVGVVRVVVGCRID